MTSRCLRWVVAVVLLAAGCQTAGMEFAQRGDVEITAPEHREEVDLPVVLAWEPSADIIAQFAANEGELFWAVFVDRTPLSPGANLGSLPDETCRRTPGCADTAWFSDRGIHFTTVPVLTLSDLDDLRDDEQGRDLHEVTIVLMRRGTEDDEIRTAITGTREGEGSVTREFYVRWEQDE